MAWEDVPTKLTEYGQMKYAPDNAVDNLLFYYEIVDVEDLDDIPEHRREEFEKDLDYNMGACRNLANSKAKFPGSGT